ncbi:D-alanyl-D-alanine carboxypeptidase/D-alanyl-D-alanine-endopeptidase [soil metagenome]
MIPLVLSLATAQAQLGSKLDDPLLAGSTISACVTDADGKEIFARNADLRVMPASNQKLLTCAFALAMLGPDRRPETRFWKDGGELTIDAPGDPLLTYPTLIDAARRLGTTRETLVYLREAYAPGIPDSWEIDDLPNKYAAPVTAFTVDRGSFELWNQGGKLALLPTSYGVKIERRRAPQPFLRYDPFERRVFYSGDYPDKIQRLDTLAIPEPDVAAASLFGQLKGGVDRLPFRKPTLVIQGRTTLETLGECMPPSDNNLAENLLLMAVSKDGKLDASPYPAARKALETFLNGTVGVPVGSVRAFDGSGMSRHDLVTTRAVTRLLQWAKGQPTADAWKSALASPGKGTLSSRLSGVAFVGKTGSLDMVAALSGYLITHSGREVQISVILNNFTCPAGDARNVIDAFIREAVDDL